MVSEREALDAIVTTIDADSRIPDSMEYVVHEADASGEHANVSIPFIEVQMEETSRDSPANTEVYDYIEDNNGNTVGRVYELLWQMTLQLDIYTAAGSDYNPDELGQTLQTVCYQYDAKGPGDPFFDESGEPVTDIWYFKLGETSRPDDLGQTPTLRRWRQMAEVRGAEYFVEDVEPVLTTERTTNAQ